MFLKVMLFNGEVIGIDNFSKSMKVEVLRVRIGQKLKVSADKLRLFFRGKQLENGLSMLDYDVDVHSIIQCMIKPDITASDDTDRKKRQNTESKESPMKRATEKSRATLNKLPDKTEQNRMCDEPSTSQEPGPSTAACVGCKDSTPTRCGVFGNLVSSSKKGEACIVYTTKILLKECIGYLQEDLAFLKVGDMVEMVEPIEGAWFTVTLRNIYFDEGIKDHVFIGEYKGSDCKFIKKVNIKEIVATKENVRFPVQDRIQLKDVKVGDTVKVIYSVDERGKKGLWYDCIVQSVMFKSRQLVGDVICGSEKSIMKDRVISSTSHMYRVSHAENSEHGKVECEFCLDDPCRKCQECACCVCGGKDQPSKQVICDECDHAYHIWCLSPKLDSVPSSKEWYCPKCKNDENEIIKAGEKPKITRKKSRMLYRCSQSGSENKDTAWGQGMACVGRTKECTIVPANHFGPIPGVEVGSTWLYRVQVGEAGVHRPHISGIHGRQEEGAYSIVLSGGYEDDKDDGDMFMYTGSGGRDFSGNRRTNVQSRDQTLDRLNLALAKNCNAPVNSEMGAVAKDWRKGKPVRVIRNFKAAKHSKYAPKEGNRYDGIYKVVKYFPMKGKAGFIIWRYQLQRDDPVPAPWTKAGKERIASLGLEMQVPEGYKKQKNNSQKDQSKNKQHENQRKLVSRSNRKLKKSVKCDCLMKEQCESTPSPSPAKKPKIIYKIENEIARLIKKDTRNTRLWRLCREASKLGKQQFLVEVQTAFTCICCQELVHEPITMSCEHTFCRACLDRAFTAEVTTCPTCRHDLITERFRVNEHLQNILLKLFPGYTGGR